jgi:hypothetical protein
MLLDASGRSQEEIERFSIVVKHEPDQITARLKLATLLRRNDRPQESLPNPLATRKPPLTFSTVVQKNGDLIAGPR